MHAYLFEAKSIQAYIFQSGRLKDVIAASERLDRLVDDTDYSTLNRVLESANLSSNLLDERKDVTADVIGFTRSKGGAFYSFCENKAPLQAFRRLWTLTVQQLFPGLEFVDALTEGSDLAEAMDKAHLALAAARNTPSVKFPLASAICSASQRTGRAAVPIKGQVKYEIKEDKKSLDLDTVNHRQAYGFLKLRTNVLISKFNGAHLGVESELSQLDFPLDTGDFPAFKAADDARQQVRDLALIHIDGNGLGILLRQLKEALKGQSSRDYSRAFRLFSNALAQSTQEAAFKATTWLNEQHKLNEDSKESKKLPMRPIVLGGDDVTLFCQADLALGYVDVFCRAFEEASKLALTPLFNDYLTDARELKPYLTASAGVLYHKASHPFVTCHQIVEGLCQEAKKATKKVDPNTGPAAVSFYRISNVLAEDIADLRMQSQKLVLEHNQTIIGSLGGYLLDVAYEKEMNSLVKLKKYADFARKKKNGQSMSISIAKFRQMATHLANGDTEEARRIYARAEELQSKQDASIGNAWRDNYWVQEHKQSWLYDLLIYAHFNAPLAKETVSGVAHA